MTKQKVLFLIAIFISLALLSACALDDCAINNWGTLSIENQSQQANQLKKIFYLLAVRFIEKGRILWHPKDERGKTIWK